MALRLLTPAHTLPGEAAAVVNHQSWHRPFVELYVLIGIVVCFVSSFIPTTLYHPRVLHLASLSFLLLWGAFRAGASVPVIFNLSNFLANLLALYLLFVTGGMLSVNWVWFLGLAWVPFVLLKFKAALAWLIFQFNALLLMLLASQLNWVVASPDTSTDFVFWHLFIKVQAALCMMLILDFLDRSQKKQLDDLRARGDELQNIHQELIRAQSHKDEFIASVGHELRTPMNAILGLNGVLKDQITDSTDDLYRVDLIRESTQHLLAVVNDILDFSQLQAQRMTLGDQVVSLKELAQELHESLQEKAHSKNIQTPLVFAQELPTWVRMDSKRFKQIINNLLENALKFTSEGHISMRFTSCDSGLRVEVEDTGIGMTEEQQTQVFGGFEKSTGHGLKLYGGTGLGLSICEKLIQLQGGQIGVASHVNQGSLFWIEIPLTPAEKPQATQTPSISWLAPAHVLIVDDHPVNLLVAQRMVQKIWPQVKVFTCNTGASALEFLKTQTVDVVLMDMFMPDMDGVQVSKAIRLLDAPENQTPILGLTASSNVFDHQQCLDAGMNDIVFKPLDAHELEAGVLRCMNGQPRAEAC